MADDPDKAPAFFMNLLPVPADWDQLSHDEKTAYIEARIADAQAQAAERGIEV